LRFENLSDFRHRARERLGSISTGKAMLFYSAILIVVAFTAAVLGFVLLGGTAAFVLRMCFVGAFLLFVISLARRKKNRL